MRQLIQDLGSGATSLVELPTPAISENEVLVETRVSLISAGTERMLVEFGRGGWIHKARQQPEKVREVLRKIRSDGAAQTLAAVRSKLEQPIPLGYSSAGVVVDVGSGVEGLAIGDRVASNGPHAELAAVPARLCARVPPEVTDEAAAFTVIGAIALQGVRLAAPTLGECFVVTGLGLIGLMTVQILHAQGCRVLGIDFDESRLELARAMGAEAVDGRDESRVMAAARELSRGRGVDGVLLTAATSRNEPVRQAARMSRKRGRIVLVGVVGLELNRADFYERELTFQVSCSYGPGRYDPSYEEAGQDYPIGFVRWTEERNFEAVLDLLAGGGIDIEPLVTHRFALDEAETAYRVLTDDDSALGIVLGYATDSDSAKATIHASARGASKSEAARRSPNNAPGVGFIGSGNYAGRVLMPAFSRTGVEFECLANQGGVSAAHLGRKFNFDRLTSDPSALIRDDRVDVVVVATRHDSHARYVCEALEAGKHVFCEKPLCISESELEQIEATWRAARERGPEPLLMVGFNRRFAPLTVRAKSLLGDHPVPASFVANVNAGYIPPGHWTQDVAVGGGRIIGEACHFIDLLRFLADSPVVAVESSFLRSESHDTATIQLGFGNGSIGTVHYHSNGHKSLPKERLEVHSTGRSFVLDDFRRLSCYGWRSRGIRQWRQDKGHVDCVAAFVSAVRAGLAPPIPAGELFEVAKVTILAARRATQPGLS